MYFFVSAKDWLLSFSVQILMGGVFFWFFGHDFTIRKSKVVHIDAVFRFTLDFTGFTIGVRHDTRHLRR